MHTVGLIGLGAMGSNLAQNFAACGATVLAWDQNPGAGSHLAPPIKRCSSLEQVIASLPSPRCTFLMVNAGAPIDDLLNTLLEQIDPGDIIVDAGNSHFGDTARRAGIAKDSGVEYVGLGVSGGPSGARSGPSMMFGGSRLAWDHLQPLLHAAAAEGPFGPCVGRLGLDGAGHFTKMVHNGIEYGEMQLIAETIDVLKVNQGLSHSRIGELFDHWRDGDNQSFLLELTVDILRTVDPDGDGPLLGAVADSVGHKGTGQWTVRTALDLSVPVPTISAAMNARVMSGRTANRYGLSSGRERPSAAAKLSLECLADAFFLARLALYAQGLQLLQAGAAASSWPYDLALPLRLWTAGCIIRSRLLHTALEALHFQPAPENLLFIPILQSRVARTLPHLQQFVACAYGTGVPMPAYSASLDWLLTATRERLPQYIIAAQRDAFGQHEYRRRDGKHSPSPDGLHRSDWGQPLS